MLRKAVCYLTSLALALAPFASYGQEPRPASQTNHVLTSAALSSADMIDRTGGSTSPIDTFLPDLFNGLPNMEVPLLLPPMRPALGLALNPRYAYGHRGTMGVGWNIAIPNISRKKARGIDYSGNSFVLNASTGASELVAVTPNEFRLRSDDKLLRVTRAADGGFVLTNKDGTTSWFGVKPNALLRDLKSDRTFSWFLERVVDRQGNEVTFTYDNVEGVPYIRSIAYGAATGQLPPFTLEFSYAPDQLSPVDFELDFATRNVYMLDKLTIKAFGKETKRYVFSYFQQQSVGAYLLNAVTEMGPSGALSRSYSFTYETARPFAPARSWAGGPTPAGFFDGNASRSDFPMRLCFAGNFSGHGRTEIACYMHLAVSSVGRRTPLSTRWQVATVTNEGWKTANWDGGASVRIHRTNCRGCVLLPDWAVADWCLTGDFEGSGRTSIACYNAGGTEGRIWRVAISTGSGWSTADWDGGVRPAGVTNSRPGGTPAWGVPFFPLTSCLSGDFEGTGRSGIACHLGGGKWEVAFSAGNGWKRFEWNNGPVPQGSFQDSCVAGDFGGTGRTSIACYTGPSGRWQVGLSTGSGWSLSNWDTGAAPALPIRNSCVTGNFNGDSKTGVACYTGSSSKWLVAQSTGSDWSASFWDGGPDPGLPVARFCAVGNFSGDPKTGIACYTGNAGKWVVAQSMGSRWSTSTWEGGPKPANLSAQCVAGDINGRGKTSIACFAGPAGSLETWLANESVPMALSGAGFPTGLGIKYSYAWTDPAEHRLLLGAQPVLKALDVRPGGPSPDIHLEFQFKGGYFNTRAREFRGFGEATVNYPATDDEKRKLVQIAFHQGASPLPNNDDFNAPVALMKGRPYAIITSDNKGVKYASTTTTYFQKATGESVFIAPSEVSSEQCEGACYLTLKHQFAYDDLGNMKQESFLRTSGAGSSSLTIERTYLPNSAGVQGLISSEKIFDGLSGAVHALTTYKYDQTVACGQDLVSHAAGRFVQTSATAVMEDGRELVSWLAYDQYGNIVCRRLPEGGIFRTQYDPTGNWPRKMTNALGFETHLEYYGIDGIDLIGGPLGFQKRIVDANGDFITSEYDELGRKTRETMPADVGGWTAWNYIASPAGQTIHSTDLNGDETYETRDGLGRLLSLSSRGPDFHWIESSWTYDGAANMKSVRGPALREAAVNAASFKHDLLGRRFEATDADGATTTTCFRKLETVRLGPSGDLLGRRTNEQGLIAEVFGIVRMPNTKLDCTNVFGFGRPTVTQFDYDSAGRMVVVTRNGRADTKIGYNRLGSIARIQDRNNGNTVFSYDSDGRTAAVETEGGVRKYIAYDQMGRPKQYDFGSRKPLGTGDIQYFYDDAAAPHGRGRLSQIVQGEYNRTMSYDSLGNILSETVTYGARDLRLERKYDFKRRVTFLSALGQSYAYKYDGGLLREISGGAGSVLRTSGLSLSGHATSFQIGNMGTINLKFSSPNDGECGGNISRLCKIEVKAGDGAPLFVEAYGYDAQGRIRDIEQPAQQTTMNRDELGRLLTVQNMATTHNAANEAASLVPLTARPDEEFRFDTFGRLQWSKEAGEYKYDDAAAYAADGPRVVGNDAVSYRTDGKVTGVGARRVVYNERGLISEVTDGASSASFKYDPEGQLLEIAGSAGSTQLFGDSFICSASGCQLRLRGLGPLLLSAGQSDALTYGVDALGSPRIVIGKEGKAGGQSFTAYGRPLGSSVVDDAKLGWGQNLYSSEASLYLLGERGFDPRRHLFLAPDPRMTVQGADALSGRYVYGNGDPFTYEDRNGQIAWFVPIIVGAIIGATVAAANGDNVLKGTAMGAIGGAFYWVGMEYLGGGAAGFSIAGAASGATNAALFGGDVGQATFNGAFVGAVSGAIFANSISVFGNDTRLGGSIDYTINAALRGAAAGGGYAAFTGDDVGKGALRGAAAGAIGAAVNMFIGHSMGLAMSGFKSPTWRNGAWEYNGGNRPFTIGNVIVGDPHELAGAAYSGTSRSLNAAGRPANIEEHEFGHIAQSQTLGLAYLPAVGLSYLIGGAFGALTNSSYQDPTHAYSLFENDSGFISVPDFL